ncbi:M23 family metallopeptidase [Burkholderia ambifaria]|uniref:M23 family metallopeptidase n=1 Tax=Burkholderia ambifaria TaxID=152480 RepID=UPI00158C4B2A|nr:M23 family metallopeptidase [Burkholderia ambifaria]
MIISPPFLPTAGLTSSDPTVTDPMMDAVDEFELSHHGLYPIGFDRRWHCGVHLVPNDLYEPVRAIADGEVVAYRVSQKAISDGQLDAQGKQVANCNNGFVLLKHSTDTGDGRTITFYSLYMHLLDIATLAQDRPRMGKAPADSSPMELAKWLEIDTGGVQAGQGKKVYRRDILGYMGRNHGYAHLHLEIFMTEEDFSAWFEQQGHAVQLGERHPVQPTSTDYWGHTYFVIPGGTTFAATPPGQVDSPYFPPQSAGTLGATSSLYVEAWFHKGQRYVRAWIDPDGNGKRTLLTPEPVRDPCEDYEYNLYQRATDLYKACPSDGYELLRFGRILSTDSPTLPEASRATYVAVPFDTAGTLGYVDVNQRAVRKLSDADFPSFMGWRKVDNSNAPLDAVGLWDIDKFRQMIGDTATLYLSERSPEFSPDDELAAYMRGSDEARAALKGFVCHAVSEWDPANNGLRYSGLSASDGFFGRRADTDPDGYGKFLGFLSKLQFLDQTSLGGGKKLWFFHPLSFIRHFRKCGWLSEKEMLQLIPRWVIRKPGSHESPRLGVWEEPNIRVANNFLRTYRVSLNWALLKFKIDSFIRQACFFGNATQETMWFKCLTEGGRSDEAVDLHGGWFGRGFLQLTNPNGDMGGGNNNYYKYFKFNARDPVIPPGQQEIQWRNQIGRDSYHASHSACAYWVWPGKSQPSKKNPNRPQVDNSNKYADICGINERRTIGTKSGVKVWYYNQSFVNCAASVNYPGATGQNPPNMNGLVDRSTSFVNALVVLSDGARFKGSDGDDLWWPENFFRREIS